MKVKQMDASTWGGNRPTGNTYHWETVEGFQISCHNQCGVKSEKQLLLRKIHISNSKTDMQVEIGSTWPWSLLVSDFAIFACALRRDQTKRSQIYDLPDPRGLIAV